MEPKKEIRKFRMVNPYKNLWNEKLMEALDEVSEIINNRQRRGNVEYVMYGGINLLDIFNEICENDT